MWYEWLIFAVIFLAVPFGVASLKVWSKKQLSFVPTAEQEKAADLKFGLLIFFYWLCDLFYMSFIIDSLVWRFIFGGIIMLVIFVNLSKAFINAATPQPKWGLVQDFIVGVGMSIYLIYIIPNDNGLRDVFIPIISAVYGGLITLVGVAWTIKKTDNDRKAESIIHATPYLQINNYKRSEVACTKVITVEELRGGAYFPLLITNIGMELCFIKYVQSHGEYIHIENAHLAPNDTVRLDLHLKHFSLEALIVSDRMSNHYKLSISTPDNRLYSIGLPQKFDTGTIGEEK